MTFPQLNYQNCPDAQGNHRMAWWDWPAENGKNDHVVVCVHGLSRQGRDFDVLAQALQSQRRVVCVDVAGRGESEWLADPMAYQLPTYAADMAVLLATLQAQGMRTLDWVGTSMGGLIGVVVAGQAALQTLFPIRKLVLNDVGPAIEWRGIERIKQYLGQHMQFETEGAASAALWAVSQGFGPHTPEQWLALTRPMLRPMDMSKPKGAVQLHYDPALAASLAHATAESVAQGEATLWALYDAIEAQTLVLRGANSDLLRPATAQAMSSRGPKAQVHEFAGVGHAPTLVAEDQVRVVSSFLV